MNAARRMLSRRLFGAVFAVLLLLTCLPVARAASDYDRPGRSWRR